MDKGTMMRLTGLDHGVDSAIPERWADQMVHQMDRYCMPPADTIPEKPRRGRRCRPGTKHPYDGNAERKIQRVCHA